MNINIYTNYQINVTNKYCYLNEEGDHTEEIETFSKVMDGGALVEFIAKLLKDKEFSSIDISHNKSQISMFDPADGTGQEIEINTKERNSVFEQSSEK